MRTEPRTSAVDGRRAVTDDAVGPPSDRRQRLFVHVRLACARKHALSVWYSHLPSAHDPHPHRSREPPVPSSRYSVVVFDFS